jgi:N-acetylneuraminic acid mutarotase
MSQADWRPKETINDTPSLGRMDMTNLDHNKRLRRATVALAAFLAMTLAASAQTSKPDTDTTKKFEAAQKVETTPAKGQWEASTPFPMPMEEPVGAVVDGKLYIIQGLTDGGFQPMGVVYMFDPATKQWTKKNPMPEPHVHHAMTAALNGKIYVFGGFMRPGKDIAWQPVNNAWEYTPDTDTWKAIAPLPTKRGGGSAISYNGKIYVIGGATILPGAPDPAIRFDGKPRDMCVGVNEEYDPTTNSWRARASMPTARNHFLGAEVDGKIYAIGGRLGSTFITRSSNTDVAEEYDVAQDLWTTKAAMPTARSGVDGGVYKGKIYVGGGEFQNDKIMAAFRAFEAYDPATNTWDQSLPRMRIPRHGFAGAVIGDQLHVVAGDIQTAGIPGVTAYTDTHDVFNFTK